MGFCPIVQFGGLYYSIKNIKFFNNIGVIYTYTNTNPQTVLGGPSHLPAGTWIKNGIQDGVIGAHAHW